MKLYLCIAVLITAVNCFSQSENIKRSKQIAARDKEKFKLKIKKAASLASNNFEVYYYRCYWNINPAIRYINGSVTSYFKINTAANKIIFDFTDLLTVDSIVFRKKKITFLQALNETLTINFPNTVSAGKKDSVSIYYHGTPPVSGDFTGGFTQSYHSGTPIIWTLSEPYGAAGWWPCRNGLDDKADSIDIYIQHPSQYKATANGLLINTISNGSTLISHYKHRYPIASYLVAIAVTNYSVYKTSVTINGKPMPVIQHIYPEDLTYFQNATPVLLEALKLYSNNFGNYPFSNERYGQTQFGWGGGMEHQTNSFVTSAETNLITHELGHQWFGDKVTCGSWQDIWLNEGFATWLADMFYTEKIDSLNYKAYVESDLAYIVSSPGGSVWVEDTTDVNRIFDGRLTYNKGAFLLRMLRWTLGDSVFFKGLSNYLNEAKLAYGFARTADLERNLEQTSNKALDYFFNQWFYGEGYPSFTVKWKYLSGNRLYFRVSQSTSKPSSVQFFKVRLPLQLSNGNNKKTVILDCQRNNQIFVLFAPPFTVKNIAIDLDKYLISANNKVINLQNLQDEENVQTAKISVSPNPVNTLATVNLENFQGKVQLQLFRSTGNIVWSKQVNAQDKHTQVTIPFTFLTSGNYRLTATEQSGIKHAVTIAK